MIGLELAHTWRSETNDMKGGKNGDNINYWWNRPYRQISQ